MSRFIRSSAVFALLICGGQGTAAANDGIFSPYHFTPSDTFSLVRGEVIDVKDDPKSAAGSATIKVLHVYSGSPSLLDTTFTDFTGPHSVQPRLGASSGPPYSKNDIGLYTLTFEEGKWQPIECCRQPLCRDGEYGRTVEQAETIEWVSKLTPPKRTKALREMCGHRSPHIARLAVRGVVHDFSPEWQMTAAASAYLRELIQNDRISLPAVIEADSLLCISERRPPGDAPWDTATERQALFKRLVQPLSRDECLLAVGYAQRLSKGKTPLPTAIGLLNELIQDRKNPSECRISAALSLAAIARDRREQASIFTTLVTVIQKDDDDPAVRFAAAGYVGTLGTLGSPSPFHPRLPYSEAQLATLSELAKTETHPKVADALRKAVVEASEKKP